jgi:transcription elongation GreA/GreB family factor
MTATNIRTDMIRLIIEKLTSDLELIFNAAKTAHMASINEENQPDNKYDTLALEASYVAQGQANRAQEIRRSIETYKHLEFPAAGGAIQLASLVTLEADNGAVKRVFIGPVEGGLRIATDDDDIMVITPASPLGKALIGKVNYDTVEVKAGEALTEYQVIGIV